MAGDLPPKLPPTSPPPEGGAFLEALPSSDLQRFGSAPFAAEEGVDWHRYWAAALRHRWWVLLGTVLGLGGGIAAARAFKPGYAVQSTIWIDLADRRGVDRGPIRQGQLLESYAWIDLVRSYVVLDDVVRQLHLYVTPGSLADVVALAQFDVADGFRPGSYKVTVDSSGKRYTLKDAAGVALQHGLVGDSIGVPLGFRWAPLATALPPATTVSFSLVTPRDAAQRLTADLEVQLNENWNFMRLELTGKDPTLVAATLNAVVRRYVAVAAELKRAKLTELTHILNDQLSTSELNLHQAEAALEGFRVRTITLPSEQATPVAAGLEATRDPVFKNFFEMRIEREQLRRDREVIDRVLARAADSGAAVQGLEVVGSVQQSGELTQALRELTTKQAELRALRYRYTDENLPVKRLAEDIATLEHGAIPALAKALVGQLAARQQVLDSLVQAAGRELQQIPQRVIEEARRRREVTIAENLYTTLEQRYEEARLAEASTIPDVRVLDEAVVPHRPIKNMAPRFILMGLFGGLALSIMGVVLADRFDRRIHYPDQVTREMGLAILGAVPRFTHGGRRSEADDITQVVEAFRTVRLNVAHAYGAAGPVVVTITSPGPGDGKSFIAGNLARAFADAGRRTLLIDGDARRGVLHRALKASRKPGLTDYLKNGVALETIVQHTDHPLLRFIGGGTRTGEAPELLGSPAMADLFAAARAAHQVILVDSPPLGAGVDPFLLGTLTGSLLLVLRTGTTDRELALAKLDVLDRLPVRVLGAILNDVEPHGAYRYYAYLSGYAAEDEPSVGKRAVVVRRLPGAS